MKVELEMDTDLVNDLLREANARHTSLEELIIAYVKGQLVARQIILNELYRQPVNYPSTKR